jgi:hypothetical protein
VKSTLLVILTVICLISILSDRVNAAPLPIPAGSEKPLQAAPTSCPSQLQPRLVIGSMGRVSPKYVINVRDEPNATTGQVLGKMYSNDVFEVLDGPRCSDNFTWWQLDFKGLVGWAAESLGWIYVLEPAESAAPLPTITRENAAQVKQQAILGHGAVSGLYWSPDGKTLALASHMGVLLYDAEHWQNSPRLPEQPGMVGGVAFSPDGSLLVYGNSSGVQFWDVKTGQAVSTLHARGVPISFSPDGSLLATLNEGTYNVQMWDIEAGQSKTALHIESFAGFSPDWSLAATSHALWDIKTGQPIVTLYGHSGIVRKVVFSPDGTLVASCGNDYTVQLWSVQAGQ